MPTPQPTVVRVRSLGLTGIISDVAPWDLPDNALSDGMNVRFSPELGISRAPSFRTLVEGTVSSYSMEALPSGSGGLDRIINLSAFGTVSDMQQGGIPVTEIPLSPGSWTSLPALTRPTVTFMYGNMVINYPGQTPSYITAQGSTRTALSNWPSDLVAQSIRAYGDQLMALNIRDGDGNRPRTIRHSGFGQGLLPTDWDITSTTSGAGEIDLELRDEILDGGILGQSFLVYSSNQCEEIQRQSGVKLFTRRTLPGTRGIFAARCFVELGNTHVIFGPEGIYRHNGSMEPQPIAFGKNHRRIFKDLIYSDSAQFLVFKDIKNREIWFCYRTLDARAYFKTTDAPLGCNMAAVWNYENDTWSFVDLPYITHATSSMVSTGDTWDDDTTETWDSSGGSWDDGTDPQRRYILLTSQMGNQITKVRGLILDGFGEQSNVALTVCNESFAPAWVERSGLDLDIEDGYPLHTYKHCRAMYIQGKAPPDRITVTVGGSLGPVSLTATQNKATVNLFEFGYVPLKTGGRYLSYRFDAPFQDSFYITGFDLDTVGLGNRNG